MLHQSTKVNAWKEDGNGKLSTGDLVAAVDTCRVYRGFVGVRVCRFVVAMGFCGVHH